MRRSCVDWECEFADTDGEGSGELRWLGDSAGEWPWDESEPDEIGLEPLWKPGVGGTSSSYPDSAVAAGLAAPNEAAAGMSDALLLDARAESDG